MNKYFFRIIIRALYICIMVVLVELVFAYMSDENYLQGEKIFSFGVRRMYRLHEEFN